MCSQSSILNMEHLKKMKHNLVLFKVTMTIQGRWVQVKQVGVRWTGTEQVMVGFSTTSLLYQLQTVFSCKPATTGTTAPLWASAAPPQQILFPWNSQSVVTVMASSSWRLREVQTNQLFIQQYWKSQNSLTQWPHVWGTWPHIKLNIESKIRADIAMHPVVPLEPLKRYSGCWETLLAWTPRGALHWGLNTENDKRWRTSLWVCSFIQTLSDACTV